MSQNLPKFASVFAITLLSAPAKSAVLNVCASGCSFTRPSAAMAAASAGDTIQINGGTYYDCVAVNKDNVTLVGVNGRAVLRDTVCQGKGIIVTYAQNATLKNLELRGAKGGENLAGVRHDAMGFNLTMDDVWVTDNDNGILSSASNDTVLIKNSKFWDNGNNAGSGYAHNLYIGRSKLVTFLNSESKNARMGGHEFKSRAAKSVIDSSVLATQEGFDSRNVDASEGGEVIIQNSVLEKGPGSDNPDFIAFAPEAYNTSLPHSFTLINSTLIADRGNGPYVQFFRYPPSVNISGNKFVGSYAIANSGTYPNNTTYSSRSAAGIAAFPALPPVSGGTTPEPTPAPTPVPPAEIVVPAVPNNAFRSLFYNSRDFTNLAAARTDSAVNFDWGFNSPAAGVNADQFTARFEGNISFAAGVQRFSVTADDGVRLYVDGNLVIDRWIDQGPTTYTVDLSLSAGSHAVRVDYYEASAGAVVQLSYSLVSAAPAPTPAPTPNPTPAPTEPTVPAIPQNAFRSMFYHSGNLVLARIDSAVNFSWGSGSPAPQVNADNFTARFEGSIYYAAGTHRFTVTADDGVRLYVDDKLVIDKWFGQSASTYTADVVLTTGYHSIRMEYFEGTGDAVAKLNYTKVTTSKKNR